MRSPIHRRDLLRLGAGFLAGAALSSAVPLAGEVRRDQKGRLSSRPHPPAPGQPPSGLVPLQLAGSDRDGALYVPPSYRHDTPAPLILSLHGAGGSGRRGLRRLQAHADATGFLLLVPDSREATWDVVRAGVFGPDVDFLDRALDLVYNRYNVDPARIMTEGFSDGASYALCIGLVNGDLFSRVIAFSPGFVTEGSRRGKPRIYVSHGVADRVLPIDLCSRRIVKDLRGDDYDVRYTEFEGGHDIPPEIAREAVAWMAARG
jgi:phospholipase/carboxylesterase